MMFVNSEEMFYCDSCYKRYGITMRSYDKQFNHSLETLCAMTFFNDRSALQKSYECTYTGYQRY